MSEEKSTVPVFVASITSATLLIAGIFRANKNNTSAWMEILNILKDIGLWVFAILFALFIICVIYFLMEATLQKICATYIMWEKSQSWFDIVEASHAKSMEEIREFRNELAKQQYLISSLSRKIDERKVSPSVVENSVVNAEEELLNND